MTLYPVLAAQMGLSDTQAGFLIGASVHDVAQAIGGGFSFSQKAGEVATIVKLTRVALLAPMLMLVALWLGRGGAAQATRRIPLRLPWFLTGFLALRSEEHTSELQSLMRIQYADFRLKNKKT